MDSTQIISSPPNPPRTKLRPRYPRTRQGCLTCRQRKKKCDEAKPRCVACNRNKLSCVWPSMLATSLRNNESAEKSEEKTVPSSPEDNLLATIRPFCGDAHFSSLDETIEWTQSSRSFSSPKRAALLTQSSHILLEHYLAHTGALLATTPARISPFITCIVPLSYADDLLMHAILALSGSHLSCKQPENLEIQRATYLHCAVMLKSIRTAFHDVGAGNSMKSLRLLLVLLIFCHFEVVSGNISGSIFLHLRACHQLIQWLLHDTQHEKTMEDKKAFGFALEIYAYLTLANTITPHSLFGGRTMPTDPLITSLETLSKYETFGTMFAGAHGLFEFIPRISDFHQKRLEAQGEDCSPEDHSIYSALRSSIVDWKLGRIDIIDLESATQRESVAEIYRHSLLIYLETAVSGAIVNHPGRICAIQDHVDTIQSLAGQVSGSQYCSILLWPLMIAGSCMVKEAQRNMLAESLTNSRYQMRHCLTACELLKHLWADTDKRSYGPHGMSLMMQKYNINCCLA